MSPSQASIDALKSSAQERLSHSRRKIAAALRELITNHETINVQTVARRAGVTRATVYRHADLLEKIRRHRQIGAPIAAAPAPADDTIVAALRMQIRSRDQQIADLRRSIEDLQDTIATLHGEIDRLS